MIRKSEEPRKRRIEKTINTLRREVRVRGVTPDLVERILRLIAELHIIQIREDKQ